MAFCELKYFSPALEKKTAANLIVPEANVPGPYATLYLLHGLSDDHTTWQRQTSIERYVEGLPLIVVMPDGGRGFYTDAAQGMAWETAIVRDLVAYVDGLFCTRAEASGRAVAGLSMGGYGAVKFSLKYPDIFCAGVSHSGALGFAHSQQRDLPEYYLRVQEEFQRVHGPEPKGGPDDLFALAAQLEPERRPALRIDCGFDDFLLEENRAFHAHLRELHFSHEYQEYPGEHNWAYWDTHVQQAIAFVRQPLQLSPDTLQKTEDPPRD